MDVETVRERAADLPDEPGVYQFLDGDEVLYVGKAVDLRDRVRSYVDPRSDRIGRMVNRADAIDVAVTDTETQALLLEANLIKRHAPRYNVRLKDDKSYPLVQLTDHERPRIEITRDPNENAIVYGPFTDRGRVETIVKAIRDVYGVRGCSDHKYANRNRPCIDYEIGICTAPCTGEISVESYAEDVTAVRRFFEGETGILAEPLRREMEAAVEEQAFERAATLRDRLEVVERFHGDGGDAIRSREDERTVDVLAAAVDGEEATVARLHSENGQLIERDRHTLAAPEGGGDRNARVLSAFVQQYYAERSLPDAVLLPERLDDDDIEAWLAAEGVSVRVPGTGRGTRLVDLALKNARRGQGTEDGIEALATALGLDATRRIEGFDVSHSGGKAAVGSNVTFVDGRKASDAYRRKKLDDENDDYANVQRLVEWRAHRAVDGRDDRPDPDLLVVDGGEGQLAAARDALDEVGWEIPVIGIAKGDGEDRVVTSNGSVEVPDPARRLLARIRDEAHRFAVQYHEAVRDDVSTPLDEINGVGPQLRGKLLRRFGSVDAVREASFDELRDVDGVGTATAEQIDRAL